MARRVPGDATKAVIAWVPAPNAESYDIEMAEGNDPFAAGVSWTRAGDTTAAHYVLSLLYANQTMIRLRGVGLADGPFAAATLGSLIVEMWSTGSTLMWTADPNLMWSA